MHNLKFNNNLNNNFNSLICNNNGKIDITNTYITFKDSLNILCNFFNNTDQQDVHEAFSNICELLETNVFTGITKT